ncbi:MAG TPA: transcription elongation factor GreA [Tissierellia bacterium]|jgi:transcription elongation factor GreA|nr:transcription elongation factor GreA [Tissierellia bacterium]
MDNKGIILTRSGLEKAERELEFLRLVKKKEIAERIKEARLYGDLSENAEYDEAKNAQAENEFQIEKLENIIKFATILDEDDIPNDTVYIGTRVVVMDEATDENLTFEVVGALEADPFTHKVSNASPLGAGLIGRAVGDVAEIETPAGKVRYRIMEIARKGQ